MSVIKNVDDKVQSILSSLHGEYSEEDFLSAFKAQYPEDYQKCMKTFLKEERHTKPGKTHPMQHPDKHIKNALRSYLSRKTTINQDKQQKEMKSTLQKLGLLMAVLLTSLTASAYNFAVGGIYYNVWSYIGHRTCTVTHPDDNKKYKGNIEIPAEVNYKNETYSVVAITSFAFAYCPSLTSVTIPDSVTEICEWTFAGSSSLTSVTIPDSVTKIGDYAFYGCSSLTSVTIPDSVTEIGDYAFYGCSSLTSVTIPDSVTEIKRRAFYGCSSLTSVIIPDSVWEIRSYAFYDCSSLATIELGNSVTEIGEGTFCGCSSLTSVTIPDSVWEIRAGTFFGCSSLTSITIPDSVIEIEDRAFYGCSSLTSITIPDSVIEIGDEAFEECSSLSSVIIPDSVWKIGNRAFRGCSSLATIELGNSLQSLGDQLFNNCTNLKSFTFPGSIEEAAIGNLFSGCVSLKEMRFLYNQKQFRIINLDHLQLDHLYLDRKIDWGNNSRNCVKQIKQLSLGPNLSSVELPYQCYFNEIKDLETIHCYSLEPPTIGEFSNAQYMNLTVRVPYEALEAYQNADVWKNFWNLEGFDASGVEDVKSEPIEVREIGRYDLNGKSVSDAYEGITVIRYSDGTTKKVIGNKN